MALPQLFSDSATPGTSVALTTLSGNGGAITSGAASMNLAGAPSGVTAPLLSAGQTDVVIDQEILTVQCPMGTTTTILARGVDGSSAAAHNDGATVLPRLTQNGLLNLMAQLAPDLQNGVVGASELLIGTISINTVTCALTFTPAATGTLPAFVKNASGLLVPTGYAGGAQTITPSTPVTTDYAVIGVEIDTTGAISLVKGTDTATQLNTAALIAANSPATSAGKLRIADIAVWNNAGTYNFSDHTTVAAQGVNWIDRRPWARGAYTKLVVANHQYLSSSASVLAIDATNLLSRIECTGNPMRMMIACFASVASTIGQQVIPWVDSATIDSGIVFPISGTSAAQYFLNVMHTTTPAAGSHTFQWAMFPKSAALGLGQATAAYSMEVTVEEIMHPLTSNGVV